jgi:hypothetical protein
MHWTTVPSFMLPSPIEESFFIPPPPFADLVSS